MPQPAVVAPSSSSFSSSATGSINIRAQDPRGKAEAGHGPAASYASGSFSPAHDLTARELLVNMLTGGENQRRRSTSGGFTRVCAKCKVQVHRTLQQCRVDRSHTDPEWTVDCPKFPVQHQIHLNPGKFEAKKRGIEKDETLRMALRRRETLEATVQNSQHQVTPPNRCRQPRALDDRCRHRPNQAGIV